MSELYTFTVDGARTETISVFARSRATARMGGLEPRGSGARLIPALSGDATTGLPRASIDVALMVDVYHELGQPERFLAALKEALKPEGRLVLVEFRGEDPSVPIKEEHKMTAEQAIRELAAAGFALVERQEFLPWQHILIFAPRR